MYHGKRQAIPEAAIQASKTYPTIEDTTGNIVLGNYMININTDFLKLKKQVTLKPETRK